MVEVTIAVEGSHGVCVKSPKNCDRYHTSHAALDRPRAESPGPQWAGGGHVEACFPYELSLIRSASSRQLWDACPSFLTELRNSNTVCPTVGRRDNASIRTGGWRRRPRLGCNGQDMVNVRQGKPVTKKTNGGREAGR
jgi:hypothetical protein